MALAGIVAVTVLVVVGLAGIGSGQDDDPPLPPTTTQETTTNETRTDTTSADDGTDRQSRPRNARLVLTAARGNCWMQVRAGGVNGRLVWEGTVEEGQSQRFVKHRRLWVELGAPANLNAKLNGRRIANFPRQPAIVVVTAKGVRNVSS